MNFDFSDEQKAFGEQVGRMLGELPALSEARTALDGGIEYSTRAWKGLAELGFQAIFIPESYGGLGLGPLEACVAAEQIGRTLVPVPALSSTYICAEAIRLFGSDAQKGRWLPGLADGSLIGTWAASEPASMHSPEVSAKLERGLLTGEKLPVVDGNIADIAIVLAKLPSGETGIVLCELASAGVKRRRVSTVDPSRQVAELSFEQVAAEPLPGGSEEAWALLRDRAAILLAFEQLGGADHALSMARDYALQRKVFGRPLASYQAVKHNLANVYAANQVARAHAYYGAWAMTAPAAPLRLAAAGARSAAIAAYNLAAQENIQTHGAIGFTWEADCHLFYRRARFNANVLGPLFVWKEQISAQLIEGGAEEFPS